jgi:CRISPR/Cas system Type II protein with McrA/HNH and RuvC-like nuclease domain
MTQIDVLYKGSEFQFNIEESDLNNYDKFIQDLRETINEKDENTQIKIMTFNTSVSYLYLNKDNFYEILNDFRNSTLKVVINVIKKEEKKEVIMKNNDDLDDVLVG